MNKTLVRSAMAVAAALFLSSGGVQAQDQITVKISHAFPANHYLWEHGMGVWAEAVKAKTDGRVEFEVYPAQQLAKSAEQLTLLSSGTVDAVMTSIGQEAARLPLSSVGELPGMFASSCEGSNQLWEIAKPGAILDELEYAPGGFHVIFDSVLPPYVIMTSDEPVTSLEDLEGLKIRVTGGSLEQTMRELGAVPVRMASSELFESASRGTVDGALYPYSGLEPYDLQTVFHHSTEGASLGAGGVIFAYNGSAWEALPEDVRQAMMDAGREAQANLCQWMDDQVSEIKERVTTNAGFQVHQLGEDEKPRWNEILSGRAQQWAGDLDESGRKGSEVLEAYRSANGM